MSELASLVQARNCTLYDGVFTAGLVLSAPVPVGLDTPPSPSSVNPSNQGEDKHNRAITTGSKVVLLIYKHGLIGW